MENLGIGMMKQHFAYFWPQRDSGEPQWYSTPADPSIWVTTGEGSWVFEEGSKNNVLTFRYGTNPTGDFDGPSDLADGLVDPVVNSGISDLDADVVDWDAGHVENLL